MAKVVRRCYNSTSVCRDNRRKTFEPERGLENNEKEKKVKVYYIDEDIKGTCFLVQGEQEAILFDPGMAYYGETVVQRVREILGTQPLRAVFLTHSHYDHVAAVPYVRQEWPEIKVYAAEYACHIFEKTKVQQMMFHMSKTAAEESHHEWKSDDYKGELLYADKPLEDGDRIALGEFVVEVIETIGHTQCSVSFLINDEVMISSETIGLEGDFEGGYVPAFLISYKKTVDSLRRTRGADPKQLYMPHRGLVIPDERYWKYMEKGLAATKDEIIRILASYPTLETQILEMEEVFWKKAADGAWPREAFDMNAKAMLRTVAAEFPEELSKAKSIQK